MSIELNWQTTRSTVRERAKFMLNNNRLSDVKFVAANSNGESERKQVIPAHKFMLAIGSPVFEAMFYGELAETKDTVELPDCDYESLLELFRYIYSDEVNLSGSNVMGVLYLAKKYIVPSLTDKCTEYLKEKLDPSNVFSILPSSLKYEEKALEDRCWKVIDNQTEASVNSEGFETIERSLLEAIVARDTLTIKEVGLFKAVDRWATKQCEKQSLAAEVEFASFVPDTNLLNLDEITVMFKFFAIKTSPVAFSKVPRRKPFYRVGRFQSVRMSGCSYDSDGSSHSLNFTVDGNITLKGICLLGSENNTYTVTLNLNEISTGETVISKTGTYSSTLLQCKDLSYYGFEVLFDSTGADLKKSNKYCIQAKIAGPPSGSGENCLLKGEESGVTFTFPAGSRGQFSEFLFSV
ncbi:unnamed protein product [Porites evermanni]|uniref:BTB domain-containing protein n=1 Tax=Porites evermanni TaxID=104178 RepID=A0ABN8QQK6_9CNID|nr:unnamed protein product [Porites evermanni]